MNKLIYILFALSILSWNKPIYAQKSKTENLAKFDNKIIHFGFSLAINSGDFDLKPAVNFQSLDSIHVVETQRNPGFNLGIICDLHLHKYFNLRFVPALSFVQRNINYTYSPGVAINKGIESTFIDFPLHLKYRSARLNNFATYIIGGGKYSMDLASQAKVENIPEAPPSDIILKLKKNDYSVDLGFGFDFFLEYFKLSPELRVSFGIPNVLIQDKTMFSNPINALNSRMLLISLNFEG